ncbi:hypothetical protein [Streptomyces sp. HNM0574]|uniref:hypothetical protein n=1 Tax=Streptomyces sp. HNM0574 TaxID=2714954 RepID=UPI00146D4E3A|nr:hypothetical protein [Streptomyces sp. HNM0574]NLU68094.1 hypothetical protein [Streptomyces sp. HNM0574]
MRRSVRRETETALRERLHAADARMEVPEGLWERIRDGGERDGATPRAAGPTDPAAPGDLGELARPPRQRRGPARAVPAVAPVRPRGTRPGPLVVTVVAACAVVLVVTGVWWLLPLGGGSPSPPASGHTTPAPSPSAGVQLTVHNAESACRELRTLECSLRLAENPREKYAAHGNRAGRVWHGDRIEARCVITDGRLVRDESGISSTRWYLTRTRDGADGWLPGVRTRNSAEVRTCSPDEVP